MSSKAEDFPTPDSPIKSIVRRVFSLFLIIQLLRDSTSLEVAVSTRPREMLWKSTLYSEDNLGC